MAQPSARTQKIAAQNRNKAITSMKSQIGRARKWTLKKIVAEEPWMAAILMDANSWRKRTLVAYSEPKESGADTGMQTIPILHLLH